MKYENENVYWHVGKRDVTLHDGDGGEYGGVEYELFPGTDDPTSKQPLSLREAGIYINMLEEKLMGVINAWHTMKHVPNIANTVDMHEAVSEVETLIRAETFDSVKEIERGS